MGVQLARIDDEEARMSEGEIPGESFASDCGFEAAVEGFDSASKSQLRDNLEWLLDFASSPAPNAASFVLPNSNSTSPVLGKL